MPEMRVFQPDRTLHMLWGEFSYSDSGAGSPPVVLIHGHTRLRTDWDPLLPQLAGRRLIRPDLCGHGGSSVPTERFSLTDLMYDILALADELWLGRFDVVGHSLGGMIALALLRAYPHRVGKVALVEGWTALRFARPLGEIMGGVDAEGQRAITTLQRETLVRWPPLLREQFWRTVELFDATDVLGASTHPILEIYGDRGQARPPQEDLGVPRRPNIELAWVPGGTHYLPNTHPRATGQLLRRFLLGDDADKPESPSGPPPSLLDLGMRR